ncbi:MAG: hypothetical protein QHH80_09430 [Anaerolineae bacterium]|nr:hypothetical protein [Anaerolineae bacterium]
MTQEQLDLLMGLLLYAARSDLHLVAVHLARDWLGEARFDPAPDDFGWLWALANGNDRIPTSVVEVARDSMFWDTFRYN